MKKGFTLIELLGVIILLGVIALITFPIVDNAVKNNSAKSLQQSINNIEEAARQYGIENKMDYNKKYQILDLKKIKESGILKDEQILNPETDEPLEGCVIYVWSDSSNQHFFVYSDDCVLPTDESCFTFNFDTKTITDYDSDCKKDVIIPGVIDGISVENISNYAFRNKGLTSINFDYLTALKDIRNCAFCSNNLMYINISRLRSIEDIYSNAFNCNNNILKRNFIGKDEYTYDYFDFSC